MWGAVAGDIIGSAWESAPTKRDDFPLFGPDSRFTDDTVLTVAVARALLRGADYADTLRAFARRYPDAGYGGMFARWVADAQRGPYGSWANGAAMRVSPIAWAFDSTESVLTEAARSAAVTHDHPEGVHGAQAVALAVFLARNGHAPAAIRAELARRFGYAMERSIVAIRPGYRFDVSACGSVPEAVIAGLEGADVERSIRMAVSLGGDSDTQACIAGAVAEARWGTMSADLLGALRRRLPDELLSILDEFYTVYGVSLTKTRA